MGKSKNQGAGEVKKRSRMRDRVALLRARNCCESMQVSTPGECPETGAAAKNTHDKKGVEIGPNSLIMKLHGITLQAMVLVWGRSISLEL